MVAFLVALHIIASVLLVFVILLQPGKGDGMGGAFGGGGASAVFGGRGSVTFLSKVTTGCAVVFMVTSLALAYRSSHSDSVVRARRNLAAADAAKKAEDDAKKGKSAPGGTAAPVADGGTAVAPKAPAPAPAPKK